MSLISLPRLYFDGQMYWTPSTMNNNDYAPAIPTYDIPKAKLNEDYLESQLVETEKEFKKWVIKPTLANNGPGNNYITPPAEWGYYNGMQCGFVTDDMPVIKNPDFGLPPNTPKIPRPKTTITGFTDYDGKYDNSDPWVGSSMQFNKGMSAPKMVDVDPQMPWATQIFCDTFTLGSQKKGQGFTSTVCNRMATRYIYPHTYNLTHDLMIAGNYSVIFQNCLRKEDLVFFNKNPKAGSFQAQLQEALKQKDVLGLMIRITAYDTYYFQGPAFEGLSVGSATTQDDNRSDFMKRLAILYHQYETELEEYKLGKRKDKPLAPVNSAYSRSVGWIGLWKEGELTTTPNGRILIPFEDPQTYADQISVQPKDLPEDYYGKDNPTAQMSLGATMVETEIVNESIQRITVDMGSTIPLTDVSGWKAEFGDVKLGVKLADGTKQIIANLPYYRKSYVRTAGVVDLTKEDFDKDFLKNVSPEALQSSPLYIQVESIKPDTKGKESEEVIALNEAVLTAETDLRGIYVNEPGASWKPDGDKQEFTVNLRHFGSQLLPEGTQLMVGQYTNPDGILTDETTASVALSYKDATSAYVPIKNTTSIPVPASGEVIIQAKTLRLGLPNIRFFPIMPGTDPLTLPPGPGVAMFFAFYTAVRVLPFDNKMATDFVDWLGTNPSISDVNRRIFRQVYGTYHMMYPIMSFIDNPTKFQSWRGKIMEVTDDALFESSRYMPVTRSMSSGQRYMIEKYMEYLGKLPYPSEVKKEMTNFFRR